MINSSRNEEHAGARAYVDRSGPFPNLHHYPSHDGPTAPSLPRPLHVMLRAISEPFCVLYSTVDKPNYLLGSSFLSSQISPPPAQVSITLKTTMEIPVLSRISGFEAEIIRLQNPSYISRFLKAQTLLTWGALIIAFIATFSSLITRINRLIVLRFQKAKSAISQPFYDSDSDDDEVIEDDNEVCSSSSEIVTDDEEDEDTRFDSITDFRVAGLNRNFSWSDFVTGRSVVKTWDGLGLGFEKASESLISLWDLNKNEITSSICRKRHVSTSPAVLVSAGDRNVAMRVFDPRIGRQFPQIFAEWQPITTTTMKLVAGDANDDVNVSSIVVRDMRKITSPVENVTEDDVETWWDSDAVIVDGNSGVCRAGSGSGSVVSRCRNAVISYLF